MAGGIRGITIELNADSSKLKRELRDAAKESAKVDKELKKVNTALKFNPKSVELWRQKQTLLKQKITETERSLKLLKQQQASMDAKGVDKNSEEYRNLRREIIETESKLKTFKAQLRSIGNARLHVLGDQFKEIGAKMTAAGKTMTRRVTLPIVAGFTAATKASMTFGDAMAKVSTLADESQVTVKDLSKEILNLSNQSGKSATDLAEAAYQALSASVETKNLMPFLTSASALAKAGFLETSDAVDVLTTVINAYGMSAADANVIADQLIQTQNDGKTTVNELAAAMGQVIPTAAALNVPLDQLNAAYAALTMQGINTANATTAIKATLNELSKEGTTVSDILKEQTGKTFGQLMSDGKTLGDVIGILSDSVGGNSEEFKNLFGNVRAGQGALALLNYGVEKYNAEAEKMVNSTGNVNNALSDLSTPGASARGALNELVNVGIQIGDVLAPYIQKAAEYIQSLIDKFNSLSPEQQKIIVAIAAIAAAIGPLLTIGGTLVTGIGTLISVIGTIGPMIMGVVGPAITFVIGIIGPMGAVFLAVAAAIGVAAMLIYKNWDKIKAKASELKAKVVATWKNLKASVSATVSGLVSAVKSKWDAMKSAVVSKAKSIASSVKSAWSSLKGNVQSTWNAIKTAITRPIQSAIGIVKTAIAKIKAALSGPISLPHIKLPHFSISGKFSLNPPSIPHIGVSWYDKGGIFSSPTVIGVGEKRPEFVGALDDLRDIVREESGGDVTVNVYNTINGADDPEEWGRKLVRQIKLEMRAT